MRAVVVGAGVLTMAVSALIGAAPGQDLARPGTATGVQAAAAAASVTEILAIEDARAPAPEDLRALLGAARATDPILQRAALRALGRLERRDVIADLLPYLRARDRSVAEEAASALLLSFRGQPQPGVPAGPQLQAVVEALALAPGLTTSYRALGRLPYQTAAEFHQAERYLTAGMAAAAPSIGALRGLESLARLRRTFLPFEDATLLRLRTIATSRDHTYSPDARRNAMAALSAALGADTDTVVTAIKDDDPEVRRLAALSLGGAAAGIEGTRRIELLRDALSDRSAMVRLEAMKGTVRRGLVGPGCIPLLTAIGDQDPGVALFALDTLGEQCKADTAVTDRLIVEARPAPATAAWQRGAHALVALAKRAPDRAALAMPGFTAADRWQMRMYAARAAAAMDDTPTLGRLALDPDDNVREATLPALRRLLARNSDDLFIAALGRRDYQLLRTAARELKGSGPAPLLAAALAQALSRVSAEQKETSRDPRLALIERLGELGSDRDAAALRPLLRDFDPVVALAAAELLRRWTTETIIVAPLLLPRAALPAAGEPGDDLEAVVTMESGSSFALRFMTEQAPLAGSRFVRLAGAGYYDGLTFHRIVANAFIQGGSPGANEYTGDRLYLRDEVGTEMHRRGSVGISTRGRDTGDAQIFINLVDNPFLEYEYTVFARVCGNGMEAVDRIQEGDRILRVELDRHGRCN